MRKYRALFVLVSSICVVTSLFGQARSASESDLVDLFLAWRAFSAPVVTNEVPDYTASAMQRQRKELAAWQKRLAAMDTTSWPVAHQIDWYLVWAEMNGLDFAHRVTTPWSKDPAFYVWFYAYPTDVPEREGPNIHGAVELPNFTWPLSKTDAAGIAGRLRT
ncbi:MAG TPA: hypothetical protein VGA55_04680, partial [Bacteroidota bacterium]